MAVFQAFENVLSDEEIDLQVIAAGTAIGGSRADQWAVNHDGKLDSLREALETPPAIVVVSLGGNDLLRAAMAGRIIEPSQRERVVDAIVADLEVLFNAIAAAHPAVPVVIVGYDYLDPARMAGVYGMAFPDGVSAIILNEALDMLEDAREALANGHDQVHFVRNLGLLASVYGDEAPESMPDGVHPTPEAYRLFARRAWEAAAASIGLEALPAAN